jgi:hypothetical protein
LVKKITIGEETREVTAREFILACNRKGIKIKRHWFRPFCDDERAQAMLGASPELEAAVLLELSKGDGDIKDALSERMAILWVECSPHSAMDAARALTGR